MMEIRCFHCGKEDGILVRLNPVAKVTKTVCMDCLWARHPKTALEILEFILDKEQGESLNLPVGEWRSCPNCEDKVKHPRQDWNCPTCNGTGRLPAIKGGNQ